NCSAPEPQMAGGATEKGISQHGTASDRISVPAHCPAVALLLLDRLRNRAPRGQLSAASQRIAPERQCHVATELRGGDGRSVGGFNEIPAEMADRMRRPRLTQVERGSLRELTYPAV